ncbi:MAG: M17 family peptidase N-terminal domain-containing protein [Arhodomonas sp.]|nr:M17 family peptidase N-terminal domain-containing protein [Arhodomonas sp.]
MEYAVKSGIPEKQRSACVVVGVFESRRLSTAASRLDEASGGFLTQLLRRGDMDGRAGQTLMLTNVPEMVCDRILLVGCGRERDFGDRAYNQAVTAAAVALQESGAVEAISYLSDLPVKGRDNAWRVRAAVLTTANALYRFDHLKTDPEKPRRPLRKLTVSVPGRRELPAGERAVAEGRAIANGMALAKDLGNLPGNICTPTYLAEQAEALAKEFPALKVEVLGPEGHGGARHGRPARRRPGQPPGAAADTRCVTTAAPAVTSPTPW